MKAFSSSVFSKIYQSAAVLAAVFLLGACGGGGGAAEGPATTITAEVKVNPDGPAEHYRGEVIALVATASIKDDGGTEGGLRLALMLENTKQEADSGGLSFAWELAGPADSTATLSGEAKQTASFTPDKVGEYTVKLTVTETANSSNTVTKTETLEVVNQLPTLELGVADGGQTSLYPTETTTLEATATDPDPEGEATFTYTWTVSKKLESAGSGGQEEDVTSSDVLAAAGGETVLAKASEVVFTAPDVAAETTYTVSVTVEDADGGESEAAPQTLKVVPAGSLMASIGVSQANGPDENYHTGKEITLDGSKSGSAQIDASGLSFAWELTKPADSTVILSDVASTTPTFTPDKVGDYTIKLTVTDKTDVTKTATAVDQTLKVVTQRPTVELRVAQGKKTTLYPVETTTLEATASDPDGGTLTYSWSVKKGGVSLTSIATVLKAETAGTDLADLANASEVVFTAPEVEEATEYIVSVTVEDADGGESEASEGIILTVTPITVSAAIGVSAPDVDENYYNAKEITLNARGSRKDNKDTTTDSSGLSFKWGVTAKPTDSTAVLNGGGQEQASFTPDKVGEYTVKLTVRGEGNSFNTSTTEQTLKVVNHPPTLELGVVEGGQTSLYPKGTTTLEATADDPDSDGEATFTYSWSVTPAATLTTPEGGTALDTTTKVVFTAPEVAAETTYTVSVTVEDADGGESEAATQTLKVMPAGSLTANIGATQADGPEKNYHKGKEITLDGSVSKDDNQIGATGLSFEWVLTAKPAESDATLSGAGQEQASFTPDKVGEYTVKLTVTETATGNRAETEPKIVTVVNQLPTLELAVADGGKTTLYPVETTTLEATATDPDSDGEATFTYSWSVTPAATLTTPEGGTALDTTTKVVFTAPEVAAETTYTVSVKATDADGGESEAKEQILTVTPITVSASFEASQDGKPESTYLKNKAITLTANGNTEAAGLSFAWALTNPEGSAAALSDVASMTPTFTPDKVGSYTIKLTVTDEGNSFNSATAEQTLKVVTQRPTLELAVADGGKTTLYPTEATTLEATADDPDSDGEATFTYSWSVTPAATLTTPEGGTSLDGANKVVFTAPEVAAETTYTVSVKATDADGGESEAKEQILTVAPITVSASFDVSQEGKPENGYYNAKEIRLNASGSRKDNEDTTTDSSGLSFAWELAGPTGSTAALSDASSITPTFIPDIVGSHTVKLTVTDEGNSFNTTTTEQTLDVVTQPPTLELGVAENGKTTLYPTEATILEATASDPDGGTLTYTWTVSKKLASAEAEAEGEGVDRTSVLAATTDGTGLANASEVVFTAPVVTQETEYTVSVKVEDADGGESGAKEQILTVLPPGTILASIEVSQAVKSEKGYYKDRVISLDASGSRKGAGQTDTTGLSFAWALTNPEGSAAALSDVASMTPTFTPDKVGEYTVTLTVTDSNDTTNTATGSKILTVLSLPPLRAVIAQPNSPQALSTPITLDGSKSTGLGLQYEWTLEKAPKDSTATIASTSEKETSFTPDLAGKYRARLKVTDDRGDSHIWEGYFIVETAEEPANNTLPFAQAIQNLDGAQTDETDQSKPVVYAGQAQHLLLAAGDVDGGGEILTTQWTVSAQNGSAEACGDFANAGIYQNTLYGLLQVPEDTPVGTVCEVTVEFYDGYSFTDAGSFETATKTEEFVVQAAPAVVQVVALDADGAEVATFSLPDTTETYKMPTSFMQAGGTTAAVTKLKIGEEELDLSSMGDLTTPTGETITFESVADVADAVAIYDDGTLGRLSGKNGTYYQVGIIDLGGKLHEPYDTESQWTPSSFKGSYDGQGLAIKNVLVYQPDADNKGLFSKVYTSTASLANMAVQGVNIYGKHEVGGLMAGFEDGTLTSSYATGAVSGAGLYVGGLMGRTSNHSTITGSHATGAVSGKGIYVGGLMGYAGGDSTITDSYATGAVSGTENYVGGLVGLGVESTITGSHATGAVSGAGIYVGGLMGYINDSTITGSHATGAVSGARGYVGGLVGYAASGTITGSHATGAVSGDSEVGGLVGSTSNGFTITGSYATGAVSGEGDSVGGLMGYAASGTITGSHATGAVSGDSEVGGLVGETSSADITDSYATGAVTGTGTWGYVGGLVGRTYGEANITSSYATGDVTGMGNYVGGLAGNITGSITGSYATGDVTGMGNYVGGLVGRAGGDISTSYATGAVSGARGYVGGLVGLGVESTITGSHATGTVTGITNVGGLVGSARSEITSSYATGAVSGEGNNVGGLVGRAWSGGNISTSYATGAVEGTGDKVGGLVGQAGGDITSSYARGAVSGDSEVGGLVGVAGAGGVITSSYATGAVSGAGSNVGGLLGNPGGTISASYWDTESTGQDTSAGGGEGKSTAEMKTQATYLPQEDPDSMNDPDTDAWWDFTAVWGIDATINDGYPYLLCAGGQGDHTPDESCSTE